ncbi:putative lipid II flippase FtsW [Ruminococcus sp. HUN007]|uniref:putative lipid II flippase FtsW n=1 Tax=Ruminococcus sp. HUN007 TaxID=1514668 RepID=UPI0009DE1FA5|nr:putative lipid II flippase FtsW [Ruminococcus sp. HUN007]
MENDSINIRIEENEDRRRKTTQKKREPFSFRGLITRINQWRVRDRKLGTVDLPFFFIVTILLVMGLIMMFSASYAWAISEGEKGIFYAEKQMKFALMGLVAMFFLSKTDYHFWKKRALSFGIYGVGFLLLLLVRFTSLGRSHNEARRWLGIGGFEFQPSEIMKFAMVILFSTLIVNNPKRLKKLKGLLPYLFLLAPVIILLMVQPHLSCSILICLICFSLIYVGGIRHIHLALIGAGSAAVITGAVLWKMYVEGFTYFYNRFQAWLDPFSDITGVTWQTYQSLVAIGSGGFFGMGLGNSRQKFQYLPESKNDFVFSIVCEELGFVGAVTVILLFAFFVFRGFYIASKSPDKFGMLVCIGITLQVGFQAFLNIAVVSNLIPNTGISLPFFSYGGTSLMMLLGEVGIVLNISRHISDSPDEETSVKRAGVPKAPKKRTGRVSSK